MDDADRIDALEGIILDLTRLRQALVAELDALRIEHAELAATLATEIAEGERARALIDQAETAFAGVAPYFTGDAERRSEGMALLREALAALSPPSPTEEA